MQLRVTLAAVIALVAPVAACRGGGPAAVIHAARGPVRVAVEVATTPAEQARGLMYRTTLADGHGMLFVFGSVEDRPFWMKNTLIPLDMLFIGADGRIAGIHPNATPLSTTPISVGRPSRWVLEVPGGYAARHGIAAGDAVELVGVGSP